MSETNPVLLIAFGLRLENQAHFRRSAKSRLLNACFL